MRKLLILLIAVTLLLGYQSGASAWDESWDFSSPSGTDDSGQLDSFIQDTKKSFAERLNGDHFFDEDNDLMNELTAGDHRHVTMLEKQAAPAHAASTGIVYTIADGTDTELGYTDAGGNDLQITVDGGLNLSGGYSITDLTISNSLSVGNDVTVTDDITAGGDITASGYVYSGGNKVLTGLGAIETTDASQVGGSATALDINVVYEASCDGIAILRKVGQNADTQTYHIYANATGTGYTNYDIVARFMTLIHLGNSGQMIHGHIRKGQFWRAVFTASGSPLDYRVEFQPLT